MKWLAMTRVFRLGSILKVAVPAVAALMVGAFWAGQQWQSGRQAQATLRVVQADQVQATTARAHQRRAAADYETRRAQRDDQRRAADRALARYLLDRPDLYECDIGTAGLYLIHNWHPTDQRRDPAESPNPVSHAARGPRERPGAGSDDDDERLD